MAAVYNTQKHRWWRKNNHWWINNEILSQSWQHYILFRKPIGISSVLWLSYSVLWDNKGQHNCSLPLPCNVILDGAKQCFLQSSEHPCFLLSGHTVVTALTAVNVFLKNAFHHLSQVPVKFLGRFLHLNCSSQYWIKENICTCVSFYFIFFAFFCCLVDFLFFQPEAIAELTPVIWIPIISISFLNWVLSLEIFERKMSFLVF